jgi:type IV pilus assembly protein PilW
MTRIVSPPAPREAGRTLIELIIAMAIGMVILIGVGALYLSSSGVSRVANQAGSAEDTGRIVMTMIGEGIKAGGYGEIVGSDYSAQGQTLFDGPVVRGCTGSRFTDAFNVVTPNYACTGVAPGDQVLFRFQSRYAVVPMDAANLAALALPDCLGASNANQDQQFNPATARAGAGTTRRLVQSAFSLDGAGTVLRCEGNGNPGVPTPIVNDMIDFRVFFRFDDGGFALAAGNNTNYAPLGGSIRDATWINAAAGGSPTDPWNYVVGVIVCITVASREQGTSVQATNITASRCPRTAVEAAGGTALTETSTDGRIRRTFIETFTVRSQATGAPSIAL